MPRSATQSKICIILNPNAAKGRALKQRSVIESYFNEHKIPIQLLLTERPYEAIELAKQAVFDGYRTIIAAGGDGTVNEVVDGAIRGTRQLNLTDEEAPVMGLIPIGRGNDFAFFANVPKDVKQACDLIVKQTYSRIDYGELWGGRFVDGRCFVNGVGIGFDSLVNFEASDFKRVSGMLSYLLGFIKIMIHYPQAVKVKITSEQESISLETQQISLCNGRRMGSTFIMGPHAELDDGLLDVVYANRPIAGKEILGYAIKFFSGSQLKTDRFSMFRATDITITADEDTLVCHTDGEEVSRGCREIRVKLFPHSLKFLRNL